MNIRMQEPHPNNPGDLQGKISLHKAQRRNLLLAAAGGLLASASAGALSASGTLARGGTPFTLGPHVKGVAGYVISSALAEERAGSGLLLDDSEQYEDFNPGSLLQVMCGRNLAASSAKATGSRALQAASSAALTVHESLLALTECALILIGSRGGQAQAFPDAATTNLIKSALPSDAFVLYGAYPQCCASDAREVTLILAWVA
jgi:hypothetical protein